MVVMTGFRVPTMVRLYYDVGKNIKYFGYVWSRRKSEVTIR